MIIYCRTSADDITNCKSRFFSRVSEKKPELHPLHYHHEFISFNFYYCRQTWYFYFLISKYLKTWWFTSYIKFVILKYPELSDSKNYPIKIEKDVRSLGFRLQSHTSLRSGKILMITDYWNRSIKISAHP